MVQDYVRKNDRQKWNVNSMQMAVEAVIRTEIGFLKASRQFNVPKSTLERYVNETKNNP